MFCHVFHQNYIVKKGVDAKALKEKLLKTFDERGAEYPAEHNVGHEYLAKPVLEDFYKELDDNIRTTKSEQQIKIDILKSKYLLLSIYIQQKVQEYVDKEKLILKIQFHHIILLYLIFNLVQLIQKEKNMFHRLYIHLH